MAKFIHKLIKKFSFRQRFVLFALIFAICIPFPLYWLISGQNLYIQSAEQNAKRFEKLKIWTSLLNNLLMNQLVSEVEGKTFHEDQINERILVDLSNLRNKVEPQNLYKVARLEQMWNKISHQENVSELVRFEQRLRLIEIIHEELKVGIQAPEVSGANLLPMNSLIHALLLDLYQIQISTVKLFYWSKERNHQNKTSFYISLIQLKNNIAQFEKNLHQDHLFQIFTNNPLFQYHLSDTNFIARYLKKLNYWVYLHTINKNDLKNEVIYLLEDNKLISNSLLNYGLSINKKSQDKHTLIKNVVISMIAFNTLVILFYLYFHILTNHFLELNDHIQALAVGRFKKCFCSIAKDDFGPVGQAFDKMSQAVQQVVGELQRLGRQLSDSTKQIAQATTEQNYAVLNDEKKIQEIEDYTRTITQKAQTLAHTMNDLSLSSQQIALSDSSNVTLKKMRAVIASLTQRSHTILQHLSVLKHKLEGNTKLFTFLSKVSNQASLLSLNSSITTSNLVNQKQSFIKITDEINRFADKTASSTHDIQKIIRDIFLSIDSIYGNTTKFVNRIHESSEKLDLVEKHLKTMYQKIDNQRDKFQTINKILQNQARITTDINKSVNCLVSIANENSNQIHALDHTMGRLAANAEQLQQVLSLFFHPKKKLKRNRINQDE